MEAIVLAVGGRAGAQLAERLGTVTSRSTLLRVLRAASVPDPGSVRVLGVDDFAFRRGHHYGTVLVDMDTRQPVDVLSDRSAESFAAWLRAHPGTEVICRDRASGYAEGARQGAPEAIQVADRWHLLHNLTSAVDRVVRAHRSCGQEPVAQPERRQSDSGSDAPAQTGEPDGRRVANTRRRHTEIHTLLARGVRLKTISRNLNLDVKTVRRYARASTPEELLTGNPARGTQLDQHSGFLAQRWQQGCDNAARLTQELRERGYRGSERSVRRLLQTWRSGSAPSDTVTASKPATAREITSWIMRPHHKLTDEERGNLRDLKDRCDTLRSLCQLVDGFAGIARDRRGQDLDGWIRQARASRIAPLRGFADGLLKDYDAVRNGLTLPWSSAAVEGNVTRIKALKRQTYGRDTFELLRRRILLCS